MKSKLDMSASERQSDLFLTLEALEAKRPLRRPARPRQAAEPSQEASQGLSLEGMATILDGSDDYRVLRRLKPRPLVPIIQPAAVGTKIGVILDTETTGLDHTKDEVIELGMIASPTLMV